MIANSKELQQYILQQIEENEANPRTLMEYLLALLKRLEQAKDAAPTFQDIADFIRDAFTGEQAEYSKEWKKLPEYIAEVNSEAYYAERQSHEWQVRNLKLHLVKLEKMRLQGYLTPSRLAKPGYNVKLFKDFYWTNLDVKSYLGSYAEYLGEIGPDDEEFTECDWLMFTWIIDEGPGYQDDLYG